MIKNLVIVVTLLAVISGCSGNRAEKTADTNTMPSEQDEARTPYYAGLIEEYKRILLEDQNNLAAIIALGNAHKDSGRWKEAAAYYERALRIDPSNADVRTDLGTVYRNMGLPDRAVAEYQKALEYNPAHQDARYNMGVVYAYDKQDYTTAIRIWEELLKISPNHPLSEQIRMCIINFRKVAKKEGR